MEFNILKAFRQTFSQRKPEPIAIKSVATRTFDFPADQEYYRPEDWRRGEYEHTGTQSLNVPINYDGVIYPLEPMISYAKRRKMLRHPTIAMARQLAIAPMVLADWSVQIDKDAPLSAKWLLQHELLNRKNTILERAFKDCIDFGWQANEIVYNPNGKNEAGDDAVVIEKFKPLWPYNTWLRANPLNGDFAGIKQYDLFNGQVHYLDSRTSQLFNIDVEGTNHYGNSMLDNCVEAYDDWNTVKLISIGYLRKIAGAHWVVYYPVGQTEYNGEMVENANIAQDLLARMEANGGLTLPSDITDEYKQLNSGEDKNLWRVENITDSGATSASYIDQLRFFNEQMVMGLMFPPRALLEGEYGTKAEAVVHAEAAVASMEMISKRFAEQLSKQTGNMLLELNYGKAYRDCAWIECSPITKSNAEFLKQIYIQLLTNPDSAYTLFQNLDIRGIGDKLNVNSD